MDRSRKIKNFGDAGGHEYCLCERPDACPPAEGAPESALAAPPVAALEASAALAKPIATSEKTFLKIFMYAFNAPKLPARGSFL